MWKKYKSGAAWLLLSTGIMSLSGGGWVGYAYFINSTKHPISVSLFPAQWEY
jgi:hypothetical protein